MRRLLLAAGAVAILVATSGCVAPDPRVTPGPTPSATPVFASDEEALAAAEAAYAAYLAVSDAISSEGGARPERLSSHLTDSQLKLSIEQFEEFQKTGNRTQGSSSFDSAMLQRYDNKEVAIYLCLDVSSVRIVNADGADVTPPDRPARLPLEILFLVEEPSDLRLSTSDIWNQAEYCAP